MWFCILYQLDIIDLSTKMTARADPSSPSVGVLLHMVFIYKPKMQYLGFEGPHFRFFKKFKGSFNLPSSTCGGLFYDFY